MLKYKGGGFLPNVPARDLTDEEVKQYGKDRLIKSGLYVEDKPREEKPKRNKRYEPVIEQAEE